MQSEVCGTCYGVERAWLSKGANLSVQSLGTNDFMVPDFCCKPSKDHMLALCFELCSKNPKEACLVVLMQSPSTFFCSEGAHMQCSVPPDNSALSHLWVHAGQWQYHMSNDATYPVLSPIFLSALSERSRQDECVLCPHPYPTLTCSLPFNLHCAGHHSPTWHLRLSSIPGSWEGSMH